MIILAALFVFRKADKPDLTATTAPEPVSTDGGETEAEETATPYPKLSHENRVEPVATAVLTPLQAGDPEPLPTPDATESTPLNPVDFARHVFIDL